MNKLIILAVTVLAFTVSSCGNKSNETAENKAPETTAKQISQDTKSDSKTDINQDGKMENVSFECNGMTCAGCEQSIQNKVSKLDGVKEVKADSKAKIVQVTYAGGKVNKTDIEKAINEAGYDTKSSEKTEKHDCSGKEGKCCKDKK